MRKEKDILKYYGKCCVDEYRLLLNNVYDEGADGKQRMKKDALKLEDIRGQKKAIEFIFV